MWRRIYFLLVLVRLWFALSPSYIHPDEHFQGPEIVAGEVLGYPVYKTWEFTSDRPLRSTFPLWIFYAAPLTLFQWLHEGFGYGRVPPAVAFRGLRVLMFLLSFVLGDWAIHALVPHPRDRRVALTLIASCYVTAAFQTHTFSNSLETLLVLWTFVLAQRLRAHTEQTSFRACAALAFLLVLGVFNRITFPAFVLLPLLQLLPSLRKKPLRIPTLAAAGLLTAGLAVAVDTEYYTGAPLHLRRASAAVLTPWNNLAYNLDEANLAAHGLHARWQHFGANLPQLLGPALVLVLFSRRRDDDALTCWSGLLGTAVLSIFRHQEARFLLPAVPLLLASVRIPRGRFWARSWIGAWLAFNVLAAALFGVYHQAGVIPAQTWLAEQPSLQDRRQVVFWWKTYSPPRWLLGAASAQITTVDLMGVPGPRMLEQVRASTGNSTCRSALVGARGDWRASSLSSGGAEPPAVLLVAPLSARFLVKYTTYEDAPCDVRDGDELILTEVWQTRRHIGLDDLDFAEEGLWGTLERVIGRRGLGIWRMHRPGC